MTSPRTLLMTGALTPLPDLGSQFSAYAWTESLGTFPLKRLALSVRTLSWQRQSGLTSRTWQSVLDIPSTFAFIAHRALVVLAAPSSGRECIRARQAHATVPRRLLAMGSLFDALAYRRHHAATSTKAKFWPRIKTWRCFPHWDGTGNSRASQHAQPHGVAEWLASTAKRHANEWFMTMEEWQD